MTPDNCRFIVTDTLGLLLIVCVMAASVQDRDYERHPATSEAMIRWAAINGMVRRLARGRAATRQRAWTLDDLKALA